MALNKSPYRGTRDFFPKEMRLRNFIFKKMAEVSELFAYEPYDGPLLEEVDLYLAKSGEELINEQIYSFVDRGERKVAIRPEMTPTVARMVAQIHREVAKPLRWYSIPNLMRYEKPQKGRLREFWQFNADIFGAGQHGEVEIIQLAVTLLRSFGATHEHFEVLVNDRRFVDLVFGELIGLDPVSTKKLYKLVDAKNKMAPEKFSTEVRVLTNDENKAKVFEAFVSLKSIDEVKAFAEAHLKETEKLQALYSLFEKLYQQGLSEYVKFDPSIVRGLDYYTGVVFEIFDKHPENRRAIAGGGAFANLLQIFNEPALEGVGIGLGEVPLTDFLNAHNLMPDLSRPSLDYLVAYLDSASENQAMELARKLREQNKKVELYFGEAKPKKVFNYSDKKDITSIIFVSETEIKQRDVKARTEITRTFEEILEGTK